MTLERTPEGEKPVRADAEKSAVIFTRRRVIAGVALLLGGGALLMNTLSETEEERSERQDLDLTREIADVYEEMIREGNLPPGVRPQQLTADVRTLAVTSTHKTMRGIWEMSVRETSIWRTIQNYGSRREMKAAHRIWVRNHLKDAILAIVDQD